MKLFSPEPEKETVTDDKKIQAAEQERDKALTERDTWAFKFQKLIGTKDPEEPRRITYGTIDRPIELKLFQDTVRRERILVPNLDIILSGVVRRDGIRFYTANMWDEYTGGRARKIYEWDRKRENFYFAMKYGGGMLLTFERPLVTWEGLWVGMGADVLQKPYLVLEPKVRFMDVLEVDLALRSTPSLTLEAKVRL